MIPVIIPSYEPDEHLLELLKNLDACNIGPVIVVNDGSQKKYDIFFKEVKKIVEKSNGKLLVHEVNKGKGQALKTAFQYVVDELPQAIGVVTADSDGQHTVNNIRSVLYSLVNNPDQLILGVRRFDIEGIPWKSRGGNLLTKKFFSYITGCYISDTQTGLRGIPYELMKEGIKIEGERFDYEMRVLIEAIEKYSVIEIPIDTIYDSEKEHHTHFNPIVDSFQIYRVLLKPFLKFVFSSGSASLIDLTIFILFCNLLKQKYPLFYISIATLFARIFSTIYNYIINYKAVFVSKKSIFKSWIKYIFLAVIQMLLSAIFVSVFVKIICTKSEVTIKILVDIALFFISYHIQKRFIF